MPPTDASAQVLGVLTWTATIAGRAGWADRPFAPGKAMENDARLAFVRRAAFGARFVDRDPRDRKLGTKRGFARTLQVTGVSTAAGLRAVSRGPGAR